MKTLNIDDFDCHFNNQNNQISSGNYVIAGKGNCLKYFVGFQS